MSSSITKRPCCLKFSPCANLVKLDHGLLVSVEDSRQGVNVRRTLYFCITDIFFVLLQCYEVYISIKRIISPYFRICSLNFRIFLYFRIFFSVLTYFPPYFRILFHGLQTVRFPYFVLRKYGVF